MAEQTNVPIIPIKAEIYGTEWPVYPVKNKGLNTGTCVMENVFTDKRPKQSYKVASALWRIMYLKPVYDKCTFVGEK